MKTVQYNVTSSHTGLQRQSAVTTYLVKIEIMLEIGFVKSVLSCDQSPDSIMPVAEKQTQVSKLQLRTPIAVWCENPCILPL